MTSPAAASRADTKTPALGPDGVRAWNDRMAHFYSVFPYPGRYLWVFPAPERMLHAHAGVAALLQQGEFELARRLAGPGWWPHSSRRVESWKTARAVLRAACERVPKARLLLAGCGTDEPVLQAALHPDAAVDAVDLSARSLRRARLKWWLYGMLHPKLRWLPRWFGGHGGSMRFVRGDVTTWLGERASTAARYDHIVSYGVLHHQRDPRRMLAALARALAQQGTMRLMFYSRSGRALERASQRIFLPPARAVGAGRKGAILQAMLLWLAALRLRFWLLRPRGGRGSRATSHRLGYLSRSGLAAVADALLHPCDPGLEPRDVVNWAHELGCVLIFCRARSHAKGWIVGVEQPHLEWQRILEAEAAGDLVSNIEVILAKS